MAVNEQYDPSFETYDDSDIAQAEAQAAQQNSNMATIDYVKKNTQTPVVLQPSSPPLNPKPGDMWIDTSIFPNIIYSWDGVQWNRATVTAASEVGAYTTAQVDNNIGDVQGNVNALSKTVNSIQQSTTPDALMTTITGRQEWASKADKSYTDNTFVTQTTFTQNNNSIQAMFSSGGGINLLKNSTGYSYQGGSTPFQNWQLISGSFSQYIGNDCVDSGAGFTCTTGDMKQAISVVPGQAYTVTCKVKKGTAGTGYLKVSDGQTFQEVDLASTAAYNYTIVQVANFVPQTNSLIIEIQGSGVTGGIIFTAIMVNIGQVGLQWCHALGELYNTTTQMDINGIKVFSSVYNGYTVMSPQEFSGYYMNTQGVMQKVFTLNKDTTQVAKLSINDPNQPEIDMGDLKILNINGGGYDGWAIVGNS